MRLSQQEHESYLWGAATNLRGLVDAGDYEQSIFPLLFHRHLSDVGDEDTPIAVERVVNDIDGIVCYVCFDGWQSTSAGEREVRKALRKTLFKYKLHQAAELFNKAYGYIR